MLPQPSVTLLMPVPRYKMVSRENWAGMLVALPMTPYARVLLGLLLKFWASCKGHEVMGDRTHAHTLSFTCGLARTHTRACESAMRACNNKYE